MKRKVFLDKLIALSACVLCVVILLTACAQPAPAVKTPAPPADTGPKYGGTLKIGVNVAPTSLDSFITGTQGVASFIVLKAFGQPLLRWEGKSDREARLSPLLAKSWEVSPDGLTYTFHLREGVKWQNSPLLKGREFTADDYAYHLNRINDPANKNNARTTLDMKSCEVLDKYTIKVTTNKKSPPFLSYFTTGNLIPYPKEVVEAPGGADKNWLGTGAFILSDFAKDSRAILTKNPDYWEKGKPYLDSVEFYFMRDPATQLAAFRAGEIDVLPSVSKSNRDAIEKSVPGAQIQDGVGMAEAGLLINNKKTPLNDKLVRQAIQYAIDYEGVINSALDGSGMRTGYLAPWFAEYGARQAADLPTRDVAKAKALLAQAGYPDGFKTTIMQNTGMMDFVGNAVEPVTAMLKEVGIEASIVAADNPTFISNLRAGKYDLAVYVLTTARPADPDLSLRPQWRTKGAANTFGYSNPKVDELIDAQQNVFPDKEKRAAAIKQILTILEDEVPSVPLYIRLNYFIKQPWVKGWDVMADPHGANATGALPDVWIDKK